VQIDVFVGQVMQWRFEQGIHKLLTNWYPGKQAWHKHPIDKINLVKSQPAILHWLQTPDLRM
jgi:hypothetical protein